MLAYREGRVHLLNQHTVHLGHSGVLRVNLINATRYVQSMLRLHHAYELHNQELGSRVLLL